MTQQQLPLTENKENNPSYPISPWIYLAGITVTLSGIYAVNYGINDPGFALLTYSLTLAGYIYSYLARRANFNIVSLPLTLILGSAAVVVALNPVLMGMLLPPIAQDDRFLALQVVFVWVAIVHTYLLSSDSAVLFTCVPCMTMLALVSAHNSDPQLQNAFIVFVGASIFLMVHENYLRTQHSRILGRTVHSDRRLFSGQLQLAALCLAGALLLAQLAAVPIQKVGQSIFGSVSQDSLSVKNESLKNILSPIHVNERKKVQLATGPVSGSDIPLLKIQCNRPLYWRGAVFTHYDGVSFSNIYNRDILLTTNAESGASNPQDYVNMIPVPKGFSSSDLRSYAVPPNSLELPPEKMKDSSSVTQNITEVNGVFSEFYGAGNIKEIKTDMTGIITNTAEEIKTSSPLPPSLGYEVVSQVATDSPEILRSASSSLDAVPFYIRSTCLQKQVSGQEDQELQKLTNSIIKGLTNNYDRALAIKNYISFHCKYNLNAPAAPRDEDIVYYFLFKSHQGYCDSFGAAMTMLARYAGIPARFASGFITGKAENDGTYSVRENDKHIWSELFFPNIGWVTFDATDGAQDITQSALSSSSQGSFARWMVSHGIIPPLIFLSILCLLVYVVWSELRMRLNLFPSRLKVNGQPITNSHIADAYRNACLLLSKRGIARPNSMTADEFAAWIADREEGGAGAISGTMERLTALHVLYRYGTGIASVEETIQADEALEQLDALLKQRGKHALLPAATQPSP